MSDDERRCYPHIRALMAGSREGMIVIGPDRTVRLLNERAGDLLGVTRDDVVGSDVGSLGVPDLVRSVDAALEAGVMAISGYDLSGREHTCAVAPYDDPDGGTGVVVTIRDDSDAIRARRQWEAVLSSTSDGLIIFDADVRVTFVNPAAERFLGRGAETLVGLVTDPWVLFGLPADAEPPASEGAPQVREVRVEEPEHRIMDVRLDRVLDGRGEPVGSIATIHDVTIEREATQMKNEFVSTVSHELRTPLTSIKGYIDLILDGEAGEISEIQREFLGIVKENSDRLVELINDMLDISRIESGRIVLKVEPLDLAERITGAVNTFGAILDQQGRAIRVRLDGGLPRAAGDPDRVGQVLINFISNAIKYSPAGGDIDVTAELRGRVVRVGVTDHGLGISPENQQRLFTKFYRVDSSLTREIGGTGLGLSICKSIIELLGGQVGVESAEGEGSTFWFELPVAPSELVRTPALEGPLGSPGGRILVVDDSEQAANLIATYLERRGYEVRKASTPGDALAAALEFGPRVITLDVMLGEGAGFELLQELKADARTKDIPVVVLSIVCDEGKSSRLGATGYLEKPIDKTRLVSVIDGLIGSIASPVVLVADDDRAIVDLLSHTLKQRGYAVMAAYDGREAMAAVARRRPDAILLDLRMPDMDGYQVLEALKSAGDTADIPVVVMSAYQLDYERASILKLASQLVCKPFDADEFVSHVEAVMEEGS